MFSSFLYFQFHQRHPIKLPSFADSIMPLLSISERQTLIRKPEKQKKNESYPKPKSHSSSNIISNVNYPTESRNTFTRSTRKNNFFLAKLKGLGCKEASASSSPVSRNKNLQQRRKISSSYPRNHANAADVSYTCCTPPGVGIDSDFVPRPGKTTRSMDHRKYSRVGRRNVDDSDPRNPGSVIGSKLDRRSLRRIIEMIVHQENLHSARRIHTGSDRYKDWRLDIDDMSYEELLDLSDGIGNVCTGLKQEEISKCLRKFRPSTSQDRDWRCSVCQEKCREAEDIGTLKCGHHHHLPCIKQWLLQKNSCPVCKAAAI